MSKIEQTAAFNPGDDGQRLIVFTIYLGRTAQVAPFRRTRLEAPSRRQLPGKAVGFFPQAL
jgi:hypothetical protein